MSLINKYNYRKDQWWALPLIIPLVFYPLFSLANVFTTISGQEVILYYLPMSLIISLMMFYGVTALPGIIAALVWHYWHLGLTGMLLKSLHVLVPVVLSWVGYRIFVTRRHGVTSGSTQLVYQRVLWQVFCPASFYMLLTEVGAWLNFGGKHGHDSAEMPMLITYQALLAGAVTGVILSYVLIRILRHPRYLRSWFSQLRAEFNPKVTRTEMIVWLIIVLGLQYQLLIPSTSCNSVFSTNYTLSLLLPVMLWGSMRYGFRFMSLVWPPLLILAIHYFYRILPCFPSRDVQIAIVSSRYLTFTFMIFALAGLASRRRVVLDRTRRLASVDPMTNLPNLRALNRELAETPWSVLYFLRIPVLELLGRSYGVMFRIQYKQRLADWLKPLLQSGECVYQLSGHDMVIRLNTHCWQMRIGELDTRIKQFRFLWDDMHVQPPVGISYCYVRSPVQHLYLLLGEMITTAEISLVTNQPESLQNRGVANLQRSLKSKVDMMNRLQNALEEDHFLLMAQLISGVRGDDYYEILLRMGEDLDNCVEPNDFLPVAQEFGLSSRIDLWVIEHVLRFMALNRKTLPAQRFAINLSPASVCRAQFAPEVEKLLRDYAIEAWQLIFEISEDSMMPNMQQAGQTIAHLQKMGCRVAIDDFGTGYASYAQMKNVNADMLKIDGSFIRNVVSNSLDYQIVASICHLARMKKMVVVAEHVESEEIRSAVVALGIDYLQGYLIGKPVSLEKLIAK